MTDNNQTAAAKRPPPADQTRHEPTNLSDCYGTIGIEAVAAAVRYADTGKRPAYTTQAVRIEQRFLESAG